jgi:hypothetical protein
VSIQQLIQWFHEVPVEHINTRQFISELIVEQANKELGYVGLITCRQLERNQVIAASRAAVAARVAAMPTEQDEAAEQERVWREWYTTHGVNPRAGGEL